MPLGALWSSRVVRSPFFALPAAPSHTRIHSGGRGDSAAVPAPGGAFPRARGLCQLLRRPRLVLGPVTSCPGPFPFSSLAHTLPSLCPGLCGSFLLQSSSAEARALPRSLHRKHFRSLLRAAFYIELPVFLPDPLQSKASSASAPPPPRPWQLCSSLLPPDRSPAEMLCSLKAKRVLSVDCDT